MRNADPFVMTKPPYHGPPSRDRPLLRISLMGLILLTGCPPDNTPLIEENERLQKRIVKQESMMTTLQEGNRVLQEQIDRLNQELRENENEFADRLAFSEQTEQALSTEKQGLLQQAAALTQKNRKLQADAKALKDEIQGLRKQLALLQPLSAEKQDLLEQITALTQENQTLQAAGQKFKNDAQWLRKQRERVRQSLQASNQKMRAQKLPYTFPDVSKATFQALVENGYRLMAKMETDQKSVFVTEQKVSPSPSFELPGSRNQYLVELEAEPDDQTLLKVRAQYEQISQEDTILEVGEKEIMEIEHRLIQAIKQVLDQPKAPKEQPAPSTDLP